MTTRLLISCRTASARWDMRLGKITLQNTPHMAAGIFGCIVSTEARDPSLSHCKNYWSKEWVNLIETVALISSVVSSVETFSNIVEIMFPTLYLFQSSRISQYPLQDRDLNSPLSTSFTNFPHLLFLASNYGNLLIPRFGGHRREAVISIHIETEMCEFFKFSTSTVPVFPWGGYRCLQQNMPLSWLVGSTGCLQRDSFIRLQKAVFFFQLVTEKVWRE